MASRRRKSSDESYGCLAFVILGALLVWWGPTAATISGGLFILAGLGSLGRRRRQGGPGSCAFALFGLVLVLIGTSQRDEPATQAPPIQAPITLTDIPEPIPLAEPTQELPRLEPAPGAAPLPADWTAAPKSEPARGVAGGGSSFWLGVVIVVLCCVRIFYGVWTWAFEVEDRLGGPFGPEIALWRLTCWLVTRLRGTTAAEVEKCYLVLDDQLEEPGTAKKPIPTTKGNTASSRPNPNARQFSRTTAFRKGLVG
jgi:hypothetical protein